MQAILEQNFISNSTIDKQTGVFGEKIGIVATLFGCWHTELSRPFKSGNESHRSCMNCGARKRFDSATLRTFGPFYFPPKVSDIKR
jgi:hypothetical protein